MGDGLLGFYDVVIAAMEGWLGVCVVVGGVVVLVWMTGRVVVRERAEREWERVV